MGCHFLLQGIFPTQGLNPRLPCLLRCRQILSHLTTGEAHLYGVGLCTHTHTHLFRFFSRVGCDKILSILYEHCLDLSLFFLVLPQYLFPCTFFERLKQHLTISMGHISGRCFGEFSAQGLIDCACAQFLGQCDVHIGQRLQRCLVERIQRLNMAIFANKLYFIYGEKTLKSSQKAEKWSI